MRSFVSTLAVTLVLASCTGSPPPATPVAPAPDCGAAVATTGRFLDGHHTPADEVERIKGIVALRCVEDHWTAAATTCVGSAADLNTAHACMRDTLTVTQHQRIMAAFESAHPPDAPTAQPPAVAPLVPESSPPTAAPGQAAIAAKLNDEGSALFVKKEFATASRKFREAVARVPEAKYFLNLCLSLFNEGKFDEALVACQAGTQQSPEAALQLKLDKASELIKREAHSQGLDLRR
ncbi:MAG: hypothetical protein IPQ07_23075 [Myxococcales bacterium]|nr:hypothetical protein [Myxococcales bacterium]